MATVPAGIEEATLLPWLEAHVPGLQLPLTFDMVPGGKSNLTYIATDAAGRRFVLRRPPLKQVLATAHDMGREHRIITALRGTDVPVPDALAYTDDPAVNGAPFYVMSFVEGNVVRNRKRAERLAEPARRVASERLIDTLAAIHAVDPDAVGLGDLGRRDGYVARQLKRWHGQLEHATSAVPDTLHEVHDRLAAAIPEQGAAAIVHGDFRLDNCLVGDDGNVNAVLDWELCTLGDPLADLGLLLVYWRQPSDGELAEDVVGYPTTIPGFLTRDELVARYAERTGRDVSDVGFYVAFGFWKLGCILQGVVDRFRDGAMGDDPGTGMLASGVQHLADQAAEALS